MILKINQLNGKSESTFPKAGRVAGDKSAFVEIQKGERQLIRDIVGIEDDMDIDEMRSLGFDCKVFVVAQKVMRNVRMLENPPVGAVEVLDSDGELVGYEVEPYPVMVASYVTLDEEDAFRNEPSLQDKKDYLESIALNNASATATAFTANRKAEDDYAARKLAKDAEMKATIAARKAARRNTPEVAASNVEPVLS